MNHDRMLVTFAVWTIGLVTAACTWSASPQITLPEPAQEDAASLTPENSLENWGSGSGRVPMIPGWQHYHSDALGLSIQHPLSWSATEREGVIYLGSGELFGEGERYAFSVYVSEIRNPEGLTFDDMIASANLAYIPGFEYTREDPGPYSLYRTTDIGSRLGMLSYFIEGEDRFVELDLDPYDSQGVRWAGQGGYVELFHLILSTVRLDEG